MLATRCERVGSSLHARCTYIYNYVADSSCRGLPETIIQANFHLCTADRQLRKSCRQCRAGRLQRRSCRQCKEGRHRRKGRLRCTSHRQCGEGRLRCTSRRRKRADHRQRTSHKRADHQQRKIHKRAGRRQRTSHGKRRSCIQNRATHLDQDPRWARSRHALSRNLRKASRRRRVGYFLFSITVSRLVRGRAMRVNFYGFIRRTAGAYALGTRRRRNFAELNARISAECWLAFRCPNLDVCQASVSLCQASVSLCQPLSGVQDLARPAHHWTRKPRFELCRLRTCYTLHPTQL